MPAKKIKCKECGEEILGRADKIFCSDYCRNSFHNRENSDVNSFIRNISNTLRKNRRILNAMIPEGKANIHKSKLVEAGFNFNYFTHIYKTQKDHIYYFCYDCGYLAMANGFYLIVRRKEYKKDQ